MNLNFKQYYVELNSYIKKMSNIHHWNELSLVGESKEITKFISDKLEIRVEMKNIFSKK